MNYRSDAVPSPIIAVEALLVEGANVPDEISVNTTFNGISSGTTIYDVDPQTFDASDPFRFVQRVDAPNLDGGMYDWTMTVTLDYGTSTEVVEFTGQQAVINRTDSEFGVGWWLSGLDRLHVDSDGILLENGDGSTFYFAESAGGGYGKAVGDLDYATLVDNGVGSGFTLTDKWGGSRTFNDDGLILSVQRLNLSLIHI